MRKEKQPSSSIFASPAVWRLPLPFVFNFPILVETIFPAAPERRASPLRTTLQEITRIKGPALQIFCHMSNICQWDTHVLA